MKRKCIQETFVMILCALFFCACSGCALPSDFSSVSVTTKEEQLTKTTSTTVKSSARTGKAEPSAMNTSEIAIRVVDKSNVPIANLRVSMRHLTGDKYNYTPDLAFTDADGTAYGRAVAKTYELTVEDVEGDVVFNKITAVLEVEKGKGEYVVSWPYEFPAHRKRRMQDTAVFRIKVGETPLSNAHIELYVGHFETNERWTTARPEVIDLGYSNEKGEVIWGNPLPGKYTLYTYITEKGEEQKVSQQITITSIPYANAIIF